MTDTNKVTPRDQYEKRLKATISSIQDSFFALLSNAGIQDGESSTNLTMSIDVAREKMIMNCEMLNELIHEIQQIKILCDSKTISKEISKTKEQCVSYSKNVVGEMQEISRELDATLAKLEKSIYQTTVH